MNAALFTTKSHPSDKEIALLAFENWKSEGCSHLRPEHWLFAERELIEAYAVQSREFAASDSERDEEIISCFTQSHASHLATKG